MTTNPPAPSAPPSFRAIDFPPPLSSALATWLQSQYPSLEIGVLYEMCRFMRNKYPQFNEKSKLEFTAEKLVTNRYRDADYGNMRYSTERILVPGFRGWFARLTARLLNAVAPKSKWKRYSRGYIVNSVPQPDAVFTRTVEMERVGFRAPYDLNWPITPSPYGPHAQNTSFEFTAGYEPLTDTLYLWGKVYVNNY